MNNIENIKDHIDYILHLLDKSEKNLKKARNWGVYDIFKGKTLTSIVKHNKISKSEKQLLNIKKEISILNKELSDLNINVKSKINAGKLNKFLDIFTDNIFSDIYTQTKINEGLDHINELKIYLNSIYKDLNNLN